MSIRDPLHTGIPASPATVLLFVALAAGGCGEAGAEGSGFRVETFDGVPHSIADSVPVQEGPALELAWEAPSDAEVLDGAQWSNPTQIYASNDVVVVADPQIARVHVFTTDGARAGSFGRRGDGPGELGSPLVVAVEGDTVFAQTGMRPAIQLFRRSGEHIGSIGQTDAMSFGFTFLPGQGMLRSLMIPQPGQAEARWSLLDAGGEARDVELLGTHPLQPGADEGRDGCWRRGALGGDLVELDCYTPLLRVVDPAGSVLREHRIARGPIEVTPAEMRTVLDRRREQFAQSMGNVSAAQREAVGRMIENMLRQTEEEMRWHAVMRSVAGSPSGHRIVIWEQAPADFDPEESVLHVLDGEGRYLVREPLDVPLAGITVTDAHIVVLRTDPDSGLRRLAAYRLP